MMTHFNITSDLPLSPPSLTTTTPYEFESMIYNKSHFSPFRPNLPSPLGHPSSSKPSPPLWTSPNCMEQLLIHCALAIENKDATPAQQILWVLNNVAPPDGDSNQRLTCAFLRALISRAARSGTCRMMTSSSYVTNNVIPHTFSLLELAHFVDLTPWHRFGFTAANSLILHAITHNPAATILHIVDFSVTRCMQIPTLIDSLATRFSTCQSRAPPPLVRLTVAAITDQIPPVFDILSYDDLGIRLINFARSRNITLEYRAVATTASDGFASVLEDVQRQQFHQPPVTVINCQMTCHYLLEEGDHHQQGNNNNNISPSSSSSSMRTQFLWGMKRLGPDLVVMVEEDSDFTELDLVSRLRSVYNYLWIPFDTVDTFLAKGSKQREWYEADICWKIENVIAQEGPTRVERLEERGKWGQRMAEAGFRGVEFTEEAAAEVKAMLEEHAGGGWGSKKDERDLVLTWKGHNAVFASAWVPLF